jgi:[acyl-carrier-protein] S-malonyltransferase
MNWPIHSDLMRPVAAAIAPVVASSRSIRDPLVPYYGPDGLRARSGEDIRRYLGTEFLYPTLWNAAVEAMVRDGHRTFLEVGPGDMLSKMTRWIDRSVSCQPAGTLSAIEDLSRIFRKNR